VALVLEGELEIVQESPTGEVVVVNVVRAGEWLGEMSCLDGRPHSATVRSRGVSVVQRLSAAEFRAWLQEDPQRWSVLFDRQSQRVRSLTQQMARLTDAELVVVTAYKTSQISHYLKEGQT
jgi:CRP-like cAMP-binding protein